MTMGQPFMNSGFRSITNSTFCYSRRALLQISGFPNLLPRVLYTTNSCDYFATPQVHDSSLTTLPNVPNHEVSKHFTANLCVVLPDLTTWNSSPPSRTDLIHGFFETLRILLLEYLLLLSLLDCLPRPSSSLITLSLTLSRNLDLCTPCNRFFPTTQILFLKDFALFVIVLQPLLCDCSPIASLRLKSLYSS
jgi:hypothetical protein